jgi:membrane-bound metal-dependent hydrolase YbcI (DUF457 family)
MSPVGHSLTGLAIGYAVLPVEQPLRKKLPILVVFALLASGPDFLFWGWGRVRYDISHSIFTALLIVLALGAFFWYLVPRVPLAVLIGGTLAWYSHFLLDTLYNHGKGLAMFWPISERSLAWPVSWFSHMTLNPLLSAHNLRAFATEGIVYGTLLVIVIAIKHLFATKKPTPA